MRQVVGVFGLMLAVVAGLIGISQVSSLEDSLEGLTSGPLQLLVNDLTFFYLLLVVIAGLGLIVAATIFLFKHSPY